MDAKPRIADAGNVVVPAYLALLARGDRVRCEKRSGTDDETWRAENDTVRFVAEDVLALLGLVAMFEARGSDWKASDQQIDDFLEWYVR